MSDIRFVLAQLYKKHIYLYRSEEMLDMDKRYFEKVLEEADTYDPSNAIYKLCSFLKDHYGKKPLILIDEYDTPMHEAYVGGFWKEIVGFFKSLFNSTLKTNPHYSRALLTGITRVSRESMFSDLNNLDVVATTSEKYETAFGFTEEEVFASMDEMGLTDKEKVKEWYDGFVFGRIRDMYNPWSIINYLQKGKIGLYWANTSSNALASKLIREGNFDLKTSFETLLKGGSIRSIITEQIAYDELHLERAVYALLVASGYLKIDSYEEVESEGILKDSAFEMTLSITNLETRAMFRNLFENWFLNNDDGSYNGFLKALLAGDLERMNLELGRITLYCISSFDSATHPAEPAPERFYHGLVLGLTASLMGRYQIRSNRESGLGRYDMVMIPRKPAELPGIIIEFKVKNEKKGEKTLEDTVGNALLQIKEMKYEAELLDAGVPRENIHAYGFAFEGKEVLIGC